MKGAMEFRKGREYQMSPNSAAAMLHWRTLVNLVNMLDVNQQQELQAISTECNLLGEPVNTPSHPTLSSTPEVEAEVPTSAEPEGKSHYQHQLLLMPIVMWICF